MTEHAPMLKALVEGERVSERDFDLIYPKSARKYSRACWTPLAAALQAAALLVERPGARVLDVGSGGGKLCLVGALTTLGLFTGVEREADLVEIAKGVSQRYGVARSRYLHGDAMSLDWAEFDALYFFNPFVNSVENEAEFMRVIPAVQQKLAALRPKTRVVTYHGFGGQMPSGYREWSATIVGPGLLQLWVRE